MEDAKIDDPKVIAAIATAVVALVVGLLNLAFSIFTHFGNKRHDKSIAVLKAELERTNIVFENEQDVAKTRSEEKFMANVVILGQLQEMKDACNAIIRALQTDNKQYQESLASADKVLSGSLALYKDTYMKINEEVKEMLHSLKNHVSQLRNEIHREQQEMVYSRKNTVRLGIEKREVQNVIDSISAIQNVLLGK